MVRKHLLFMWSLVEEKQRSDGVLTRLKLLLRDLHDRLENFSLAKRSCSIADYYCQRADLLSRRFSNFSVGLDLNRTVPLALASPPNSLNLRRTVGQPAI